MFRACASQNVTKDERTSISLPDPARFSFVCPLFWRLHRQEPGKARGIYLMWMEWWNIKYHFKTCWSYRTLQKHIWYSLYSLTWRVLPWIFRVDSKLAQTNSLQFEKFLSAQHSLLYEKYFTRPQGISVTSITRWYLVFVSSELLWPEGDEALSEHAVGAVESILTLQPEHRPGAKGIALEGRIIVIFSWLFIL